MGTIFNYIAQAKYLSSRNWIMAVNILESAIQDHPDEAALYAELADIYINKKEIDKAIFYLKKAIKLENNDHYYFKLGNCFMTKNDPAKAIRAYNDIKQFYPEAYFNQALAYNYTGKYDKAMEYLDVLVENNSNIKAVYVLILENLLMAQDYKRMEKYLEPTRALIGEDPEFNYILGQYYFGKKNFLGAYAEFQKVSEKQFYMDKFVHYYAVAAFEMGKTDKAFEIIDKGLTDFPYFYLYYYDRIRFNLRLKNKRKANADFKILKNKDPRLADEAEMLFYSYKILK